MEIVFIPKDELQTLVIDSVNACLKHHSSSFLPEFQDKNQDSEDRFLKISEAAEIVSCSEDFIRKELNRNNLDIYFVGRNRRIKLSDLMAYMERRKKPQ